MPLVFNAYRSSPIGVLVKSGGKKPRQPVEATVMRGERITMMLIISLSSSRAVVIEELVNAMRLYGVNAAKR